MDNRQHPADVLEPRRPAGGTKVDKGGRPVTDKGGRPLRRDRRRQAKDSDQ